MKNTTTTTKGHHHHHSFSHTERKGQLFPLHRSITNDSQSRTNSSPITRFVCKLLGMELNILFFSYLYILIYNRVSCAFSKTKAKA